jgi:hypothetical protein
MTFVGLSIGIKFLEYVGEGITIIITAVGVGGCLR